jgi:hypothetical protein
LIGAVETLRRYWIVNPGNIGAVGLSQFLEGLGPTYGVKVVPGLVRTAAEIESTIAGFGNAPDRGLIVVPETRWENG